MITVVFVSLSSLVICVSYWARRKFSGVKFKGRYFILCVVCNFPFGIFHLDIIVRRCVKYVGYFPNLHFDYPVLSWFAFLFAVLHCFALPSESEPGRLFRKKQKSLL